MLTQRSQSIQRTRHLSRHLHHVGVDHRRLQISMTQQQLDGANVGTRREQVGGERMPQRMNAGVLVNSRQLQRLAKWTLD